MAEMVILGSLAAFGALCTAWLLTGAALPGGQEGVLVCPWRDSVRGRGLVIRWRIQRELGLLGCRLAVIDLGLTEEDRAFLTRWGADVEIWEREDGTGT